MKTTFAAAALCSTLVAALAAADVNDWPSHDHDAGGQRFSPLDQITPANVATLQSAWTFDTGAMGIQVTPLVVGGIMYVTAGRDIIALEPETATVIWRFTAPAAVSRRGVAYWPGDRDTPARLFSGAGDRLLAVDAERGRPAAGEAGVETWEGESWKNRSGTNVWSFFTIDTDRGIVYAPVGSPTSDYYGGDRKGANLYGNSIVALDAATGKLKWHRQLVHHDLWDYDLPSAPTLVDVTRNGRTIPAVAVMTKMALLFIFDRVTGEPLFGIEERAVPQSTVPGEATWSTQPFPIKPPPLARNTFDPEKDFYALTPDHAAYCKELWTVNAMYTRGPYTPPGVDGTMVTFPSTLGGATWNGLSYDPTLGLVFTNVMNLGQVAKMVPATARDGGASMWVRRTPWGGTIGRFWNPETRVPCS